MGTWPRAQFAFCRTAEVSRGLLGVAAGPRDLANLSRPFARPTAALQSPPRPQLFVFKASKRPFALFGEEPYFAHSS